MSQIFLFTGENSYQLREEKKRWISEFVKKHGPENLVTLSGKSMTLRTLLDEVAVAPFIAQRRLVVLEGMPGLSKEEIALLQQQIHPQIVLLIVDPALDKRLSASKAIIAAADVRAFAPLPPKAIVEWVCSFASSLGTSIDPRAVTLLLEMVGYDQDMLAEELCKLSLAASGRTITGGDIERLTLPTDEGVIWKLSDMLAVGRREDALLFAGRFVDRGGEMYGLWAVLLNMLRNLVAVAVAASEGKRDIRALAAELQLHPNAVRSLLPYASRVRPDALRCFLEEMVDADVSLKTGQYRATDEAPQELLALIDRFILTAPR